MSGKKDTPNDGSDPAEFLPIAYDFRAFRRQRGFYGKRANRGDEPARPADPTPGRVSFWLKYEWEKETAMASKTVNMIPAAEDLSLIDDNAKRAEKLRRERFKADHESVKARVTSTMEALAPYIDLVKPDSEVLKKWQRQEHQHVKRSVDWRPPTDIAPLEPWHNPTFIPGRDAFFPFEEKVCVLATACEFRGTDPSLGRIGAATVCDAVGAASTASALTSVGVSFIADRSGTLSVSISGRVWGFGHIGVFFSGYAEAVAGLRVYIERLAPTFSVYEGRLSNWYSHGNAAVEFNNLELAGRAVGASHTAPADRGAVYRIWADCVQHGTQAFLSAAGVNYEVRIDSVTVQVF